MTAIILPVVLMIISIAVLVKASDFFVDGAEKIGLSFGMPSFIVGVVIVGVGTSLPELVSSIVAVNAGETGMVAGNVVGSNITNIFLVLGVAALLTKKLKFTSDILKGDLPIFLSASLLLYFSLRDGHFSRGEAVFFLFGLIVYVLQALLGNKDHDSEKVKANVSDWVKLLISPVLIYLGARFTVQFVIEIAAILESSGIPVSTEMISLSAVALGTSLPEVMVSVAAAKRNNADMVVGNIIGSNIFNTFAVMGIPGLIAANGLAAPVESMGFALPLSVAAAIIFVIITVDKKIPRSEGAFLLLFYVFFLGHLFGLL